jgi:hypothetical protein
MTQVPKPQPYLAYGWMFGHVIKFKATKDGKNGEKNLIQESV